MNTLSRKHCALVALALLLTACSGGGGGSDGGGSGGGGSPPPVTSPSPSATDAARFLTQATFGPRQQDIDALSASTYDAWLNNQFSLPATSQLAAINATADPKSRNNRIDIWWSTTLNGQDQLRQRVAFALSEIFVVSDHADALDNRANAIAYYQDLLAKDAFGNFRTLLEDVTLSPAMGLYLNNLGNQKPDPTNNIHADENYAREVMQLFSVGLVQLNNDGTVKKDLLGNTIPTYTQSDVSNLARALTGWSWSGSNFFDGPENNTTQMTAFPDYHDTGSKTVIGGVNIPAGGTAASDLKMALDAIFNHPNVGPFISRQLIQHLVTSNPSPAYVARVTAIFNNNGQGVRGDLQAVVRAILLDSEARSADQVTVTTFGKQREPLLEATHLWRAFGGAATNGHYNFWNPEYSGLNQAPFSAPSVFNFFGPRYAPSGAIKQAGLVAPEFKLMNASSIVGLNNFFSGFIFDMEQGNANAKPDEIRLNLGALKDVASQKDSTALVERLNLLLMSGQMTSKMKQSLIAELNTIDLSDGGIHRNEEAIYLIMTSPQYQIQK